MKSYLSLIPISAKIRKRRNRMTLWCIIIAVFLVTTVFATADMALRAEKARLINRHGNWHIQLAEIGEDDAKMIQSRSDVAVISQYDAINQELEEDYNIDGRRTMVCGADESYLTNIWEGLKEGSYPENDGEILLSSNAKNMLDIQIGDRITVNTPSGSMDYTVSGFGEADAVLNEQRDVISVFLDISAFHKLRDRNYKERMASVYYVQFKEHTNISRAIADIKEAHGWTDKNISENTTLLEITGLGGNSSVWNFYLIAVVLFVLILIAGVLMISGSINSNVAQRTAFFGMMRCIGMSRQQIIRFVRLEALDWCKIAIPAGIVLGTGATWCICAILRFGVGGEFADMPLFGVSAIGILSGMIVGIVTVLISAQSPAKRAARVSPAAAVSGNGKNGSGISSSGMRQAANTRFFKIEIALGIHHAAAAKKNLFLMTGSFAISIILLLSFSAVLDFAHILLPSLRVWQPDVSVMSNDSTCSVDKKLVDEISGMPGVKQVFGNMCAVDLPASLDGKTEQIVLASYEEFMLHCAQRELLSGDLSKVSQGSREALTIYNKNNPLRVGDTIQIGEEELHIAGALSDGLFADDMVVICSEETFTRLTGETDYTMINIQLTDTASEEEVLAIRNLAGEYLFSDQRESNKQSNATYWATRLLAYGFLAIIGMITILNIINSISMSVSARIRQYGAMRAVGMDGGQLTRMIAAEVLTYVLSGCAVGCIAGLLLNRLLIQKLVTPYFGTPWSFPAAEMGMILLLVLGASAAAVYAPSKRIRNMAITDTINEL